MLFDSYDPQHRICLKTKVCLIFVCIMKVDKLDIVVVILKNMFLSGI